MVEDQPLAPLHGHVGVYLEEVPFARVLTHPSGRFKFIGVPEGNYTLRIVKEGYQPLSVSVEIIGLTTQSLSPFTDSIVLSPDPTPQSWQHRFDIIIQEFPPHLGSMTVVLDPLFPHQTNKQKIMAHVVF